MNENPMNEMFVKSGDMPNAPDVRVRWDSDGDLWLEDKHDNVIIHRDVLDKLVEFIKQGPPPRQPQAMEVWNDGVRDYCIIKDYSHDMTVELVMLWYDEQDNTIQASTLNAQRCVRRVDKTPARWLSDVAIKMAEWC